MSAEPAELEGALERKVDKMLRRGAMPEDVAAMLVKKGWEPGVAKATAEYEDRMYQDRMRELNMGQTHATRDVVRTGGTAVGGLFLLYVAFKILRLILRTMGD